jgi:hypothetical protein
VNPPASEVAEREANQNRTAINGFPSICRETDLAATTRIYDLLRHSARLRPSLLCRLARIAQHFFRLTDRRRGSLGSVLNNLLGLTGRCGGGSRGALHALAECLSGLSHARLQVSHIVRRRILHHLTPFDILLPGELLPL